MESMQNAVYHRALARSLASLAPSTGSLSVVLFPFDPKLTARVPILPTEKKLEETSGPKLLDSPYCSNLHSVTFEADVITSHFQVN